MYHVSKQTAGLALPERGSKQEAGWLNIDRKKVNKFLSMAGIYRSRNLHSNAVRTRGLHSKERSDVHVDMMDHLMIEYH